MRAEHGEATARNGGEPGGGADPTVNDGSDNAGDSIPGVGVFHRKMLLDSAISPAVASARKYRSLMRDTRATTESRDTLKRLGFSREIWGEGFERRQAGLLIPLYGPTGRQTSWQFRPDTPRSNDKGKVRKYEMPRGRVAVVDVHPDNVDRIADPRVELFITEGIKKGDALTSLGLCVVTLSGVFNWRSTLGTLGDWEDVPLRGRAVTVLFDADAAKNRNVARAMARLGRWLKSKQAKVRYIACPMVNDDPKTGVDDFLAAGGTLTQLVEVATIRPPDPDAGDDSLTDSRLAERLADDHLRDRYRYCAQLGGWHGFNGAIWAACPDEEVVEQVRQYLRDLLAAETREAADPVRLNQLAQLQYRSRISSVAALCKGMDGILTDPLSFDEDPWLLCVGNGVVDLRTGELHPHDPDLLMLRQTKVDYLPDATHPDWDKALEAFADTETADWAKVVLGTGAIGLPPTGDQAHFWLGKGANGKTTIVGAAMHTLGGYASVIASNLIGGSTPGHPTVKMELFRLRLAVVEELQEGHLLDEGRVKEITGSAAITAYRMRQDPVTFAPSHTLIVSSNHTPKVRGTDRGIWRRLLAVPFPKTFTGTASDPLLRHRVHTGRTQQQAVLAWLVNGALTYGRAQMRLPDPSKEVQARTDEWRAKSDVLLGFFESRYTFDPAESEETEQVFSDFNLHIEQVERGRPWAMTTFAERLDNNEFLQGMGVVRGKHPRTRRSEIRGVRRGAKGEFD